MVQFKQDEEDTVSSPITNWCSKKKKKRMQFKQDEEDTVSSPITNSVSLCFMLFS